jgi:hypothetical protein
MGALLVGLLAAAALAFQESSPAPASDRVVTVGAGGVTVEVIVSRSANRFHVVDQLSEWSPFCHRQYSRRFFPEGRAADSRDRSLLSQHAKIRARDGFGSRLERAFYESPTIEAALAACLARGDLTRDEAEAERRVLEAFAPRADSLFEEQYSTLAAFADGIARRRAELERFLVTASRFTGAKLAATQRVFLIANPSPTDYGGGADGGRIKLEVPRDRDLFPTFFHELFHLFLNGRRDAMEKAIGGEPGLDLETLGEGLAYALAPGIYGSPVDKANFARSVGSDLRAGKSLDDPYVRFNRYGAALRPLLQGAFETQTLDDLLPRAIDAWRAVRELSAAVNTNDREAWFCFGPGYEALFELGKARGVDVWARSHRAADYDAMLAKARPGSRIVLLFARDSPDREVPAQYQDLLPCPWKELQDKWQTAGTLELSATARGLRVAVFAAPTAADLARLVRASPLFKD